MKIEKITSVHHFKVAMNQLGHQIQEAWGKSIAEQAKSSNEAHERFRVKAQQRKSDINLFHYFMSKLL